MLTLGRREGQKIMIGQHQDIVLTVVRVRGGSVRIGIDAPRDVPIWRGELVEDQGADAAGRNLGGSSPKVNDAKAVE